LSNSIAVALAFFFWAFVVPEGKKAPLAFVRRFYSAIYCRGSYFLSSRWPG
jgi:hypothetical protein